MPIALFLSPHLDDVAFSCGGSLIGLARRGWQTHLCTVFTASVPKPTGFALACQTDKGLGPEIDYMALRRAEDREFGRRAGVTALHHLPHPEAPHRGYGSAPELFAGVRTDDRIQRPVREDLRRLIHRLRPDLLWAPQGLGEHVDHLQTIRALGGLSSPPPICWYRDTPYAMRDPDAARAPELPNGLCERAIDIGDALDAKLDAVSAYSSQLGFQFGGEMGMRRALTRFARDEAARLGCPGIAEVIAAAPGFDLPDELHAHS